MADGINQLYTDEECREALLRVARELGETPTLGKYCARRRPTEPSASTICNRIGGRTWTGALAAVGLDEDADDGEGGVTNVVPGP